MPIDPSIPLQVQTPKIDILRPFQEAQQMQAGGEQLKALRMENQQRELDLQDQAKMRQSWMAAGGDPDKMFLLAAKAGVGPKTMMATQQAMLAAKEARAKLSTAELGNRSAQNDLMHGLLTPVDAETDPAKQKLLWDQQMKSALSQGIATPQDIAEHPYPGDAAGVKAYLASLTTDKWLTAQGAAQRGAAATTQATTSGARLSAELPGIAADAAVKQQEAAGTKPIQPAEQAAIDQRAAGLDQQKLRDARNALPKTEAELAIAAKDPTKTPEERAAADAALKRLDQSKIAARPVTNITSVPGLGAGQPGQTSQSSGEQYLSTLPPATAAQVRAIAEGRSTIPSGSTRSQAAIQLRQAVFQFDPTFSEQRAQVRKSFTTGTDGRNIGALNTATVHLDQLAEAAGALANGTFVPGNEIYNRIRTAFGSAAPSNFEGLRAAVAGEMANALKGNATDPEIASIKKNILGSGSPQQLAGQVETNLHILGAKLNTYHERYQQQIPGDAVWSPVLPSAQGVFQKHGFDPTAGAAPAPSKSGVGGIRVTAPDGSVHTFSDQAAADRFKKLAGIK